MDKKILEVPAGIRYITEWNEAPNNPYQLEDYQFPHILNKVLTGCGFTEYCIRNQQNLILLSPRKFLLENKEEQHPDDVLYVNNDVEKIVDYEIDLTKQTKYKESKEKLTAEEIKEKILALKDGIRDYCYKRLAEGKPKKILVTYDSFRHVKETLQEMGVFQNYQVVVDEFQSIFIDSRFKSSTEMELLGHLRDVQRLCFVSATPMLDKYLDMLEEFKDLPYFELDWVSKEPERIKKPILEIKFTRSINEEANRVIQKYKEGKFETRLDSGGKLYESREATLFMNSVKNICQAIRSNCLHIDECNVLCARTEKNEKEVKKAFNDVLAKETEELHKHPKVPRGYKVIGRIPGKGEKHKMFTFCTRTVYLGADFYSTNSRTFIFSDSNIDSLSVDISMDLEQILGRQRLDENPWKNSANIYVKTISDKNIQTQEDFDNYLKKKIGSTNKLLEVYNDNKDLEAKHLLAVRFEYIAKSLYYKDDYIAVNKHFGSDLKPEFNNLVLVSEMRAFEIQQTDYKDRFSVFNALKNGGYIDNNDRSEECFRRFESLTTSTDKLKYLVWVYESETENTVKLFLELIPGKYKDYFKLLGPDRIKANGYKEANLKREWTNLHSEVKNKEVFERINEIFKVGDKYSNSNAKVILGNLYSEVGVKKTAKASDLEEYFVLKTTKVQESGQWMNGFEILSKK